MACSWGRDVHSPSVEQILLKFVEGRKERRQERDMRQVKHLLRIKQILVPPGLPALWKSHSLRYSGSSRPRFTREWGCLSSSCSCSPSFFFFYWGNGFVTHVSGVPHNSVSVCITAGSTPKSASISHHTFDSPSPFALPTRLPLRWPPVCCLYLWVCFCFVCSFASFCRCFGTLLFCILQMGGFLWFLSFSTWLTPLSIILSKSNLPPKQPCEQS